MSNLLFEEPPLVVSPTLARTIGLHEAIVLQQMHYWLAHSKHVYDGRKWVYNTYEEWAEQFPFWRPETIRKIIAKLRNDGLVEARKLSENRWDKTNYYTVNYDALRGKSHRTDTEDPTASDAEKSTASTRKSAPVQMRKNPPHHYTENTETSSETTQKGGASRLSLPDWLDPKLWDEWVKHRKEKKCPMTDSSASKCIVKLKVFYDQGISPKTVIEHSIAGGYQGLFAPRTDTVIASRRDTKSLDSMDYSKGFFD
jgi:hypothetical protein